ncbi:hypothetical protein M8J75_005952 [Diaphorina citri]|nr:hypothetical protein M8J75_005952 [Diaphorina citri]
MSRPGSSQGRTDNATVTRFRRKRGIWMSESVMSGSVKSFKGRDWAVEVVRRGVEFEVGSLEKGYFRNPEKDYFK